MSNAKPCTKCGSTERYASGQCKPCTRNSNKKWRANNPEKMASARANWKKENKEKLGQIKYDYRHSEAGKESGRKSAKRYALLNPEKVLEKKRLWRVVSAPKIKDYMREWRDKNRDLVVIHGQNRRARKKEVGGKLSADLSEKLFKLQRGKCACGCKQPLGDRYHLDHIMPLALGGSNTDNNIQLLRSTCNHQKHAKHPVEFMQQRGYLL